MEQEKNALQIIEEEIIRQDIQLDQGDRLALWLTLEEHIKINSALKRMESMGENWYYGIKPYEALPSQLNGIEYWKVVCRGGSYKRLAPILDVLKSEFLVGRVLSKQRLSREDQLKYFPGRGSLLPQRPLPKDEQKENQDD